MPRNTSTSKVPRSLVHVDVSRAGSDVAIAAANPPKTCGGPSEAAAAATALS